MQSPAISERRIVLLIGAVQFVNILDFMIVMPLGPDFARALGIANSQLGLIGGSYTMAAAIAGLIGATFLDRFDRRKALGIALLGLACGTIACGLATGLHSLMAARVLAGVFGGPATSIAISVIADFVPVQRRGRAMGAVMGAFSLASILGVPMGLELARLGGWRLPFFSVGLLCVAVTIAAISMLPPVRVHLDAAAERKRAGGAASPKRDFFRPEVWASLVFGICAMLGAFLMIPNFSAFFQFNLGFPRENLGWLYAIGGAMSLVITRVGGRWVDTVGAGAVSGVGTGFLAVILGLGYAFDPPLLTAPVLFLGFMGGMSFRGVAINALSSRVPYPDERAKFMSLQSAAQHFASASGAMLSTRLLTEGAGGRLEGMPRLALLSLGLALVVPLVMAWIERVVRRREAQPSGPGPSPDREAPVPPAAAEAH